MFIKYFKLKNLFEVQIIFYLYIYILICL